MMISEVGLSWRRRCGITAPRKLVLVTIFKKKLNINFDLLKQTMKKKKKMVNVMASEFSPASVKGSCVPISSKKWSKMLKAASKHFKKTKTKKKRDPAVHVKISSCLSD
ncbi:hypothetical protein Patl1_33185 [Pistacia atlantica]|uniref:Uncharacterized protein n=1 Tax=Pistacia atlantica TaxID=434234 RepID=A0ACC1ANL5_9ROSI|nr:hypothetical protein Patl1_33185 [Pistacia atlantica]